MLTRTVEWQKVAEVYDGHETTCTALTEPFETPEEARDAEVTFDDEPCRWLVSGYVRGHDGLARWVVDLDAETLTPLSADPEWALTVWRQSVERGTQLRRLLDQWREHRIVGPTVFGDAEAAL